MPFRPLSGATWQTKDDAISGKVGNWYDLNQDKAFWLFVMFAILVFLMGGGSRFDISSNGPLRAVAAVFLALGVWFHSGASFRRVAVPIAALLAMAIWMALQLVPLPYDWWTSLSGREGIAEAGSIIGLNDVSRPITFSPQRTFNSMASLTVPLAALVLLALLEDPGWRRVRKLVIGVGVVSALLGIAQITLPGSDGLYLYAITNDESAVGLFSNRNHNALFLNIALLFSLFHSAEGSSVKWTPESVWIVAIRLLLIVGILVTSSRFGLALLGVVGLGYAIRTAMQFRRSGISNGRGRVQAFAGLAAAMTAIAMFAFVDRIPAINRFERSLDADQRAETLPYVFQMLADHFPYGVGFGAFEQAYRIIEPEDLLGPRYLNHAHNDWLQFLVEGGLPAALIIAVAVIWLARRSFALWKERRDAQKSSAAQLLGLLTLLLIFLHSAVDYPLRTPAIMLLAALALIMATSPTKIGRE